MVTLKNAWNPWLTDGDGGTGSNDTSVTTLGGAWSWLDKNQSSDANLEIDDINWQLNGTGGANYILGYNSNGVLRGVKSEDFISNMARASKEDIARYQQALKDAGFLPATFAVTGNFMDPDNAFATQLKRAANQVSVQNLMLYQELVASGKKGKPLDFFSQLKSLKGTEGNKQVNTNTSVMNFSEGETRALLEDFYAEALGRRPNEDEVAKFQKRINAKAKSNASVSTTVYTSGGSTTTDKEGFTQADAQLMARKSAENKPGASGFLASTKYMDVFLSSLRGKASQI